MTDTSDLLDDPLELALAAYRRAYVGEAPAPSRELAALLGLETPAPAADPVPAPGDLPRLRLVVGSAAVVLAVGGLGFAGALPAAAQDLFDRVVTTLTPLQRTPEPRSVVPPDAKRQTDHGDEADATHDDGATDPPLEQPGSTEAHPVRHHHPAADPGSTTPAGGTSTHTARPSDGRPGPADPNRPPNHDGGPGSSSGSGPGPSSGPGNDDDGNGPDDDPPTTIDPLTTDDGPDGPDGPDDADDSDDSDSPDSTGEGSAPDGQDGSPGSDESEAADDSPRQGEPDSDQ